MTSFRPDRQRLQASFSVNTRLSRTNRSSRSWAPVLLTNAATLPPGLTKVPCGVPTAEYCKNGGAVPSAFPYALGVVLIGSSGVGEQNRAGVDPASRPPRRDGVVHHGLALGDPGVALGLAP